MWLLDRYIVRRFLLNFGILLLLLFCFAVSIDLLLELDEYVEAAAHRAGPDAGFARRTMELAVVVLDFHGPRIFQFYAYMVGLLTVGAMGFTFSHMHRFREFTAVLASGVPLQRLARPIVVAAVGLNLLQLANQEFVLPRLAPMLIRKHGDVGLEAVKAFRVPYLADGRGSLLYASLFDPQVSTLYDLVVLDRDEHGRTTRRVTAPEATWDAAAEAWTLVDGRAMRPGGSSPDRQVTVGEVVERFETDVTPEVLTMRNYRQFMTMLSLGQINEMLATPGVVSSESLERFAFGRFTTGIINVMALLMSLPFFLVRGPTNMLRASVLCAGTAIPAMMGALIAVAVDLPGIPPAVEVFLPVLVLLPVTMYLLSTIRT